MNYAQNQSNYQNPNVFFLRKRKFDSLLHCEDISERYDFQEITSKILNLLQ